ncbi:MAG: hypothetical protein U0931_14160 [Vulcanimicrobiota bacterium]
MGGVVNIGNFVRDQQVQEGNRRNAQLIGGVKSGAYNRDEFNNLNQLRNRIEYLEGEQRSPGKLKPNNNEELSRLKAQYGQLTEAYAEGDYHGRLGGPTTGDGFIDSRLERQGNQIYSGLASGQITFGEGMGVLGQERGAVRGMGENTGIFGQNTWQGRNLATERLDRSGQSIWEARHNWQTDWNPAFMFRGF